MAVATPSALSMLFCPSFYSLWRLASRMLTSFNGLGSWIINYHIILVKYLISMQGLTGVWIKAKTYSSDKWWGNAVITSYLKFKTQAFGSPDLGFSLCRGVVTVDVKLDELDINQCPQDYFVPNAFKDTARCHYETTYVCVWLFIAIFIYLISA